MASKTFFLKLKETCKKIDNDVNDIRMKMVVTREDHDKEEVASKKICEIQDKINTIKSEACDVKSMLGPKLAHTRDFIKNFKELMAETEESIATKEEYLKQYGYTPVELVPQVSEITVENNVTPCKKVRDDQPITPNILDYGISSALSSTPVLHHKFSDENLPVLPDLESAKPVKPYSSDSTPTLNVADITSTSKPKETPPFPEPLYTPAKETPPMPEHLAYDSSNFPSTPKLNI